MNTMSESQKLIEAISDIYDATLNPALWSGVVAKIAAFVGGQAGGLAVHDSVQRNVNVFYDAGFDPQCNQIYLATYSKFDPVVTAPLFDTGQVVSVANLMPFDDYLQGRFYREWARPQGWLDSANAVIEKSGTSSTLLRIVTNKTSGMVGDDMRRRLALVIPHVRRAIRIGKSIHLEHAQGAMLAETLDGLSASLFFLDARGRIVHANAAAHDILAAGDVLHAAGGQFVARDPLVNQALRDILAAVQRGDAAPGVRDVALVLTAHDGERYVAHVLPLGTGERRRVGMAYKAAAAVFVRKAALQLPAHAGIVGEAYRLTPTELRVLLAVVDVGGVPEVASSLGVADSTIKTHLGRVFEKTGARRQADLVKLVAGFSTPLSH
jgi:DNA-binding CsgD family transcriptional regulator